MVYHTHTHSHTTHTHTLYWTNERTFRFRGRLPATRAEGQVTWIYPSTSRVYLHTKANPNHHLPSFQPPFSLCVLYISYTELPPTTSRFLVEEERYTTLTVCIEEIGIRKKVPLLIAPNRPPNYLPKKLTTRSLRGSSSSSLPAAWIRTPFHVYTVYIFSWVKKRCTHMYHIGFYTYILCVCMMVFI